MKEIFGNIMNMKEGVIAHQVNCRGAIGAGVSGAIIKEYPEVERAYHAKCQNCVDPHTLLGDVQFVCINEKLTVANLFTQFDYGNSAKTGLVYTNVDFLISDLQYLCDSFPGRNIYIPGYIGCALAGADWDYVRSKIQDLPITVVYLKSEQQYFVTFGDNNQFPYPNKYLVINAPSKTTAQKVFRLFFLDKHEDTLNYSFMYNKKEWNTSDMSNSMLCAGSITVENNGFATARTEDMILDLQYILD